MLISLQLYGFPFLAMSLSLIIIIEYQALLSLSIKNCKQWHEEAGKCHCFFICYTCPLLLLSWPQAALQQRCPEESPVYWLISVCWGHICSGHRCCLLSDGNLQVQS